MYDYCIIGGGVIGCAIARELSAYEARVLLVEKEADVCCGTSGANSGIIHGGFDAPVGSKMARFNVEGASIIQKEALDLDVHYIKTGSLVIATCPDEEKTLLELLDRGIKNGVKGLRIISRDETEKLCGVISEYVTSALFCPESGIINPFELTYALRENAEENGVEFSFGFEAASVIKKDGFGILQSKDGRTVEAKCFINAAGCGSAFVSSLFGDEKELIFRKGEYLLYDHPSPVGLPVFQTPTKMGKGVLVCPTTSDNWFIGPNAVNVPEPLPLFDASDTTELKKSSLKSCSGLDYSKQITSFTGIRAVSPTGDFIIGMSEKSDILFNCVGICSPGLSSAVAIGKYVASSFGLKKKRNWNGKRKGIEKISAASPERKKELIRNNRAFGNIVCRCETVSEAEIVEAIRRGARTLDGIKKRLRTGMGRCQGGFCTSRLIEILSRELGVSPREVLKKGSGSYMVIGEEHED